MACIVKAHAVRRNEILDLAQRLVYTKGCQEPRAFAEGLAKRLAQRKCLSSGFSCKRTAAVRANKERNLQAHVLEKVAKERLDATLV
jgi:hypothetical protein